MNKRFEELSKYFCFDRKKTSMEEFFGDLTAFYKDFEVSHLITITLIELRLIYQNKFMKCYYGNEQIKFILHMHSAITKS